MESAADPFESEKSSRNAGYTLRSRISIRFHPNSLASTDHAPGPSNANAAPMVARKMQADLSPDRETAFHSARTPTRDPTTGVHSPATRVTPAATDSRCKRVDSEAPRASNPMRPRATNANPATSRINSR